MRDTPHFVVVEAQSTVNPVRQGVTEKTSEHMTLQFTVKDTGMATPKARQRQRFQAFQETKEERFQYPGMGLGLSIAHHRTRAMGGHIGFKSACDLGSVFWFELRLRRAGSLHHAADSGSRSGLIPLPLLAKRIVSGAATQGHASA